MKKLSVVYGHAFEGWYNNEELHPQPISNFVPDWYKNVKPDNLPGRLLDYTIKRKTVKTCPSFVDIHKIMLLKQIKITMNMKVIMILVVSQKTQMLAVMHLNKC